jgi:3-deoxy-D-manno-octulosonic-acid transferase
MTLLRLIYSTVLYLLLPLILLRLLIKSRSNKDYRLRIAERLGWVPVTPKDKKIIWLHAVSVGEIIAAKPLVNRLLQDYPEHLLLITSTTPTGSATVKKLFADQVMHTYFPYDLPHLVQRFMRRINPQILIIVETEIWVNLYAACADKNIPLLLINARLSAKSSKQYLRLKPLVSETLSYTTLIAVRGEEDRRHFLSLGAAAEKLKLAGNIKFDIVVNKTVVKQGQLLKTQWGEKRPVWVAASTHAGEDEIILAIFTYLKQSLPTLLLIIVPRHPERFDDVYQLVSNSNYQIQRRSEHTVFQVETDIILGDSMGEMLLWYAAADIAFIGGSLVKAGGHNPLEAIALGIPVISGLHTFNFNDIYPVLCDTQIAWLEQDAKSIQQRIIKILSLSARQKKYFKQHCADFINLHQGVVNKLSLQIKKYL